jgi:hypothetical protein
MIATAEGEYDRNVFINCPFDADYQALLYPLLFTVCYLRFTPRIALERCDSGDEDLRTMPIGEFIGFVREWLRQ